MFCSVENLSNLSDTFPHWIIRVCTARAAKTFLAIKMNALFSFSAFFPFFFLKKQNFLAYSNCHKWKIQVNLITYGDFGTAPKFGLREEIELFFVSTSSKQRRKRKFNVGFVQVLKKNALHVQNMLFSNYLLGSFRLTFPLPSMPPSPSSLLPGFMDVRKRLGIRAHFQ